ncbi:MAG: DUF5777 family beta-barrel protein [Flavobacteriaceae bacterium]|nr:DUF5777 family beta-barrel protein [Flavobacteriaceae bacterium]
MKYLCWLFCLLPFLTLGQEDLLAEVDQEYQDTTDVSAVFKGLKIVNFESTKLVAKNQFTFVVAHRFGSISDGFDTFFGLDDAVTRLNFIFGISDGLNLSVSRSSYQKIYQGGIKYRLLTQREDKFPFTVVGFNEIFINTAYEKDNLPKLEFKHRLSYAAQLLISRKFSQNLSLELAPTFFHENYVPNSDQDNSQIALGLGGRYKLGTRWSLNMDYGWHLNRASNSAFVNPLSIGIDLETGGHVFQMHLTNAQPMNTIGYLGQAIGDWGDGVIYFGFNLSRVF